MAADLNAMGDDAYARWAEQMGIDLDTTTPNEENIVRLFSETMRETDPLAKAKGFVDVANMALAMADKTLGSQVPVAKCLVLDLH
jgi:hypothetical protein